MLGKEGRIMRQAAMRGLSASGRANFRRGSLMLNRLSGGAGGGSGSGGG